MIEQISDSAPHPALRSPGFWITCVCLGLSLLGCAPEEVKQYRVAKAAGNAAPLVDSITSQTPNNNLSYTTPAGWQAQAPSQMRLASFSIAKGGDVSVSTLPGAADLLSNLNRWRGQVGLPPLADQAAAQQSVKPVQIDGRAGFEMLLEAPAGQKDMAMRVALVDVASSTWFFKLTGTRDLVKQQASAFADFVSSVKIKAPASEAGQMATAPEPSGPMAPSDGSMTGQGMPSLEPVETNTRLTYKLPPNWKEKPPSAMRVASIEVSQDGLLGDLSIVPLSGDGGGLLSNTNRWRQQLEMAPTNEAGLKNSVQDITVNGHKGYFLALYTGLEGQGMLIALIEQGGQTWFVKLTAPSKLAQAQESLFLNFVKSIEFHAKGAST